MLSPERIAKIDSMTKEEMVAEVDRGRFSVYNEESRARMEGRIATLETQEGQQAQAVNVQQLEQAVIANEHRAEANERASGPNWLMWTVIVGVVGLFVTVGLVRCA